VEGAHAGGGPLDHEARASPQGSAREHQAQVPDLGPERPGLEGAAGEEIRRAYVPDRLPDHGDGRPGDGLVQLGKEPRLLVGLFQEHHEHRGPALLWPPVGRRRHHATVVRQPYDPLAFGLGTQTQGGLGNDGRRLTSFWEDSAQTSFRVA
jgi:hypothetical protein